MIIRYESEFYAFEEVADMFARKIGPDRYRVDETDAEGFTVRSVILTEKELPEGFQLVELVA